MSSKSASNRAQSSLLDELQTTLAHGTVARRVETLRRVTDLFLNSAVDYSDAQIDVFDDVFDCLIESIETSAKIAARRAARAGPESAAAHHPHARLRRPDRSRGPGAVAVRAAR